MTNKKISALTSASVPLAGTELIPLVQSGATVSVSANNITGLTRPYTSNGIVYANTTTTLNTSSNLQFDGTNLGLGITPSAWGTGTAFQGNGGNLWFRGAANGVSFNYNMAFYGGAYNYLETGYASRYQQVNGTHIWYTAASGTAGNPITFTTAWTINSTSNFVQGVAGKGINFTANTPASGMTSQLFNWYEEGTWTPSLGGNTTYTAQIGTYTRVGRMVTANFVIIVNVIGTGSASNISGLPFSNSGSNRGGGGVTYVSSPAATFASISPCVQPTTSQVTFTTSSVLGVWTDNNNVYASGTGIGGTVTYFI